LGEAREFSMEACDSCNRGENYCKNKCPVGKEIQRAAMDNLRAKSDMVQGGYSMKESQIISEFLAIRPELERLGLEVYLLNEGKFHVGNGRDLSEDNILFECNTILELKTYLRGLRDGQLLKFYNPRFQQWTGPKVESRG